MPAPAVITPTAIDGYAAGSTPYALELYPHTTEVSRARGELVPVTAGRRYYFSVSCSRGTVLGSGSRLNLGGRWLAANGTTVVATAAEATQQTPSSLTAGAPPKQVDWSEVAPVGAFFFQLDLYTPALASSSGTFRVEKPVVSQVEPGATAQLTITNGPTSRTVLYDHTGTAEAGQLPQDLLYKLQVNGSLVTSGVTFSYKVVTGTVNGFTAASGSQSMSVSSGTGTLTLSSLGSTSATVELTAAYGASTAKLMLTLAKSIADPPAGPTVLATKSSGFSSINSTTFTDITGTMTGVMPAGDTTATINVNLTGTPATTSFGSSTVEVKVQRLISSTWTDVGSVMSDTSQVGGGGGDPLFVEDTANFGNSRNDTGLTAGGSHSWRVVARLVSGTRFHSFTGSVTVVA
jgi:hypothetical protein